MKLSKLAHKIIGILCYPHYHILKPWKYRCNVCDRRSLFLCDEPSDRYIRKCVFCRSTPKYRALVQAIDHYTGKSLNQHIKERVRIYELTTTSSIYRRYIGYANYTCSGHFSNKPFGIELRPHVYNQDCQRLTFSDSSFDMVLSSETMEHIRKPWEGFREIRRILKPGGLHVFTIPYRECILTTRRVDTSHKEDVHLLPKVYHQDPYQQEGSLVYTDYGRDLVDILNQFGFSTSLLEIYEKKYDIQDDLHAMKVFVSQAV